MTGRPRVDRHPGSSWLAKRVYGLCREASRTVLRLGFGLRCHDLSRVPTTGGLLMVANHQSFLDPLAIGANVTRRQVDYVARATLFRSPAFAALLRGAHAFPINQDGIDAAAMRDIIRRLQIGRAVLIFPEGTRSADGAVAPFKRGVAVLIKRAGCPVQPVAVEGAFDAWGRHASRPRLFRAPVEVAYGHPVEPVELMRDGPDAALERLRRAVETLRSRVHASLRARTAGRLPTTPAPVEQQT